MRADVLLARCQRGLGSYGIRVEDGAGVWLAGWTFPVDESTFGRSGYGRAMRIDAPLRLDDSFRGCPHCEANSFVLCGSCRQLTCYQDGESTWSCRWPPCRASGAPSGSISNFDAGLGG